MNLNAELSQSSLGAVEASLREYAESIERKCAQVAVEVAEVAAQTARASAPVDTGQLSGSISVSRTGEGADVVCSAAHAAFVEFGTGLGTPSPNPLDAAAMANSGYTVNASGRGEEGWPFMASDGTWRTTHGQSGKGFMAAGADEARLRVAPIAKGAMSS